MKEKMQQLKEEKDRLKKQLEELKDKSRRNFEEVIKPFGFRFYDDDGELYHQGFDENGHYIEGSNALSFEIDGKYGDEYIIHICWIGHEFQEVRYFNDQDEFFKALSNLQENKKTRLALKFEYEGFGINPECIIDEWESLPYEEKKSYISEIV